MSTNKQTKKMKLQEALLEPAQEAQAHPSKDELLEAQAAKAYQRKLWLLAAASTAFYLVLFLTVPMAVQLM